MLKYTQSIYYIRGNMTKFNDGFSQEIFNSLLEHIDNRLPNQMTMNELQRISGYSKRHLSRLFMKYAGVTPYLYTKVMWAYRILLELKFTTISVEDLCKKYNRKSVGYFIKSIEIITGECINKSTTHRNISFNGILKKHRINLPKRYLSCKFVSLFDFDIQARGIKHTFQRPSGMMMASHYHQLELIIDNFCHTKSLNRDDVWMCLKFSPYDVENYEVSMYTFIPGNPTILPEGENVSLQGDYICFSWAGRAEDTFSRIRSFYDIFFLEYMATRKEGFDISRRQKVEGIDNYYVFSYYIPVVINEAILLISNP